MERSARSAARNLAEGRGVRRVLPALLTLAAFGFLAAFLIFNRRHLAEEYSVDYRAIFFIGAMTVIVLSLHGLANKVHFRRLGLEGSWGNWFRLIAVSTYTNYLPLSAGLAVKAFYLKRVHGAPYRTFARGQITLFVIFLTVNGAAGLIALALVSGEAPAGFVGAGFALMSASFLVLLLPDSLTRRFLRLAGNSFGEGGVDLRSFFTVGLLQAFSLVSAAAMLKAAFDLGPEKVPLAACVAFAAAAPLSRLVALTPGGLGIRELLVGGVAHLIGFDARDAVIASTFNRFVEFVVICILGSLFTYGFTRKLFPETGQDGRPEDVR